MNRGYSFIVLIVLLFIFHTSCFAQDTLTYFNERWEDVCCKDSATYYRIGKNFYGYYEGPFRDYYITGELLGEGSYEYGIENGIFTWYFRNGKKMAVAEYKDGKEFLREGWDTSGTQVVQKGYGLLTWYHFHNLQIKRQAEYKKGREVSQFFFVNNPEGKRIVEAYSENGKRMVNIWDENGKVLQTTNGNGKVLMRYKNGNVKLYEEMKDSQPSGASIYFFSNGKKSSEGNYVKGKMTGVWKFYYNNGSVRAEYSYVRDELSGPAIWWHPNGKMKAYGNFDYGRRDGQWKWFNEDGHEIGVGYY